MIVSEDGSVTGSVNVAQLDEVEPKTDEARAQLEQLKADAQAAAEQSAADAERLAAVHEAQSVAGQSRDAVTTQGTPWGDPNVAAAAAKPADQSGAGDQPAKDQAAQSDRAAKDQTAASRRASKES